jgi:hypothetical protein
MRVHPSYSYEEALQTFGSAGFFQYTFADLKNVETATLKLGQFYAAHIAIVPILLLLFIVWHYDLIRLKGISLPFWLRAPGMLSFRAVEPPALQPTFNDFFFWGLYLRGAVDVLAFVATVWASFANWLMAERHSSGVAR